MSLAMLYEDFSNPIIRYHYLASDEAKNTINATYAIAAQEKEICDGITQLFGAFACEKPITLKPSVIENEALLNLYFREHEQPEGWVKKTSKNSEAWNLGHSSVRIEPSSNEWAPAYIPEKGTRDAATLSYHLKKLYNVREQYLPLANKYRVGGQPGCHYIWENIMWVSQFDLPKGQIGLAKYSPIVSKIDHSPDYLIQLSLGFPK